MKKKEEKYYLELFKRNYQDFPEGQILESESPDFLISTKGKILGIELTKIFQKSNPKRLSLQASDSIITDIILRIRNLFEMNNLLGYEVHLDFHVDKNIVKELREELAKKLFDVIIEHLPKENGWVEIKNDFENITKYPEEVSMISVYYSKGLSSINITDSKVGWVKNNMIEDLQKVISQKNSKVSNYLKSCENIWLLIHTISFSSCSFFIPSRETLEHYFDSNFGAVFFLNSFDREVHKLKNKNTT